jgi:acyl-CoA thioesterase
VSVPDFWTHLGIAIESGDGDEAVLRMDVPEALLSPFGTVHGGALATLFDTALAVAVARQLEPPGDRVATRDLHVTFVSFTRERVLHCRARLVSLRRRMAVAEGEVVAGDGTLVAKALATFDVKRAAPASA